MFRVVEKTARMIADAGRKIKQRFTGIAKFVFCVVLFYGLSVPPIAFLIMCGGIFTHKVHSKKLSKSVTVVNGKLFVCHGVSAFAEDGVRYCKRFLLSSCFVALFLHNHQYGDLNIA